MGNRPQQPALHRGGLPVGIEQAVGGRLVPANGSRTLASPYFSIGAPLLAVGIPDSLGWAAPPVQAKCATSCATSYAKCVGERVIGYTRRTSPVAGTTHVQLCSSRSPPVMSSICTCSIGCLPFPIPASAPGLLYAGRMPGTTNNTCNLRRLIEDACLVAKSRRMKGHPGDAEVPAMVPGR